MDTAQKGLENATAILPPNTNTTTDQMHGVKHVAAPELDNVFMIQDRIHDLRAAFDTFVRDRDATIKKMEIVCRGVRKIICKQMSQVTMHAMTCCVKFCGVEVNNCTFDSNLKDKRRYAAYNHIFTEYHDMYGVGIERGEEFNNFPVFKMYNLFSKTDENLTVNPSIKVSKASLHLTGVRHVSHVLQVLELMRRIMSAVYGDLDDPIFASFLDIEDDEDGSESSDSDSDSSDSDSDSDGDEGDKDNKDTASPSKKRSTPDSDTSSKSTLTKMTKTKSSDPPSRKKLAVTAVDGKQKAVAVGTTAVVKKLNDMSKFKYTLFKVYMMNVGFHILDCRVDLPTLFNALKAHHMTEPLSRGRLKTCEYDRNRHSAVRCEYELDADETCNMFVFSTAKLGNPFIMFTGVKALHTLFFTFCNFMQFIRQDVIHKNRDLLLPLTTSYLT